MQSFIPNNFSFLGKRIYVAQNHPDASDSKSGTQGKPFKTISRAAEIMTKYDEVIIAEGVYREEIPLKVNGHCYTPEFMPVFQAIEGEEVYIKGSDLFEPEWRQQAEKVFIAALPGKLFQAGIYNPFAEGKGRLFISGKEIFQGKEWDLGEDGKSVMVYFSPFEHEFEITTRRRCIKPEFEGTVFLSVKGIRIEHAAEPGPFCIGRGKSKRLNPVSGINITRTFNLPGTNSRQCRLFIGEAAYASSRDNTLRATVYDETHPSRQEFIYDIESTDHAITWNRVCKNRNNQETGLQDIFLDEEFELLIKTRMEFSDGANPEAGDNNVDKFQATSEISFDSGKNWSSKNELGLNLVPYKIHKLDSKNYIMPCTETRKYKNSWHQDIVVFKGSFDEENRNLSWEKISHIAVSPKESACGLSEPQIAVFENGKIVMLLRMGAILPEQNTTGCPSVKFFSISEDQGNTWSNPAALTYEDGQYIYSPRSYQDVFCSSKNGRVYAIFNICDHPTIGCDPRNELQIMEIDEKTFCVKRDSVSIIEKMHPEAHPLTRYSNWIRFESRETLNPVLLMRQHLSEFCPVRFGIDLNSYRYEIELLDK